MILCNWGGEWRCFKFFFPFSVWILPLTFDLRRKTNLGVERYHGQLQRPRSPWDLLPCSRDLVDGKVLDLACHTQEQGHRFYSSGQQSLTETAGNHWELSHTLFLPCWDVGRTVWIRWTEASVVRLRRETLGPSAQLAPRHHVLVLWALCNCVSDYPHHRSGATGTGSVNAGYCFL